MLEEKNEIKRLSRRGLLMGAGKIAVGATGIAVVSAGWLGLLSKAAAKEAPKLPWPYKKLDIQEVGEIAYSNWYKGFCCYAVASGILIPLQKKIGEPYTLFPVESLVWGHGGVVGWGTLCGTMLGSSIATSLICGPGVAKDGEQIANEVIHWYADTELPIYTPKHPKAEVKVKSKSNSPLCHVSVGRWMKKADRGFWTPERKDRCARLSADVAMQTVKLLNEWAEGKFKAGHKLPALVHNITAQHNCMECHGGKVPEVNTKGNPAK
ncbi:MAG: C-GCAxxG-C-C family (seleno)protein [Nitrospirota bacterium]